jgi:hypothetical protein
MISRILDLSGGSQFPLADFRVVRNSLFRAHIEATFGHMKKPIV